MYEFYKRQFSRERDIMITPKMQDAINYLNARFVYKADDGSLADAER